MSDDDRLIRRTQNGEPYERPTVEAIAARLDAGARIKDPEGYYSEYYLDARDLLEMLRERDAEIERLKAYIDEIEGLLKASLDMQQEQKGRGDVSDHRWSGWPGAWCLDCGVQDEREVCAANCPHFPCPGGPDVDCPIHVNLPCPEPGSMRCDPYQHRLLNREQKGRGQ